MDAAWHDCCCVYFWVEALARQRYAGNNRVFRPKNPKCPPLESICVCVCVLLSPGLLPHTHTHTHTYSGPAQCFLTPCVCLFILFSADFPTHTDLPSRSSDGCSTLWLEGNFRYFYFVYQNHDQVTFPHHRDNTFKKAILWNLKYISKEYSKEYEYLLKVKCVMKL